MKKILSLALAAAMMVSAIPAAYAAENEADYTAGTQITYMGTQEEAAGGAGDVWTVTVPAKMVPGDTGTVKAEGMWNSDKFLNVGVPSSVTLTYGAQTMDVAITGGSFSLIGNSVDPVSKEVEIAVEDASRLFGTWTGVLEYKVELAHRGDANGDGVIDSADTDYITQVVATTIILTDEEKAAVVSRADMNNDGKIDSADIFQINRVLNGKVSMIPSAQSE